MKGGEPDLNTAARMVLQDFQRGRLPFFSLPAQACPLLMPSPANAHTQYLLGLLAPTKGTAAPACVMPVARDLSHSHVHALPVIKLCAPHSACKPARATHSQSNTWRSLQEPREAEVLAAAPAAVVSAAAADAETQAREDAAAAADAPEAAALQDDAEQPSTSSPEPEVRNTHSERTAIQRPCT